MNLASYCPGFPQMVPQFRHSGGTVHQGVRSYNRGNQEQFEAVRSEAVSLYACTVRNMRPPVAKLYVSSKIPPPRSEKKEIMLSDRRFN